MHSELCTMLLTVSFLKNQNQGSFNLCRAYNLVHQQDSQINLYRFKENYSLKYDGRGGW